ncbi:hypothetical protein [Aestuariimicrobium kwangyangense]|uniref:hypothetical protein n=1 Tax=Aestuariimicrobium kwangyangense TaxID=396389 RepID=UPI0003B3CC49|nr:hypothetical protein [Aestuariimicrobium kwangyangense]
MTTSTVQGVVTIIAIGVLVLAVAALLDWRSKRRAETILAAPTSETIAGEPVPVPDYLTPETLQKTAKAPEAVTPDEAEVLASAEAEPSTLHFDHGLVDPRQANRSDPERLVLNGPLVLVVSDGIGSPQEVLQTLDRAARGNEAIVLASLAIDPEVVDLVSVNAQQGVINAGTLVLPREALESLAAATGATALSRADLQAGYVPHSAYGRAAWVTADAEHTTIVALTSDDGPSTEA